MALVDAQLRVVFLSATVGGRCHDKRLADQSPYPLPEGSTLLQDLGLQGFTLPGVTVLQPHKKPRGGELTAEQKTTNQALAGRRVRVEHVFSGVKRCRIVKETLRLWKKGIRDLVMEVCCGLHNLRLESRAWQPLI